MKKSIRALIAVLSFAFFLVLGALLFHAPASGAPPRKRPPPASAAAAAFARLDSAVAPASASLLVPSTAAPAPLAPTSLPARFRTIVVAEPLTPWRQPDMNAACAAQIRDSPVWQVGTTPACEPRHSDRNMPLPAQTVWGERTADYVQRVLERAWGDYRPSVDLYVRTGCMGYRELELLVRSIQIFWPRFLGKVVLVLDPPDVHTWHFVVPREDAHQWEVRFEHTPTMKARIFNQYSYLNLDRQSSADAIVTIDSDCLFFTPVTPSLLFRDGRLILPHSSVFQRGMWNKATEYFFPNASFFKWHTMVAQPVAFLRRTLPEYRQWQLARGTCLEARIAAYITDFPSPPIPEQFCWMCQLGTFIDMASAHRDLYYLHDCDDPSAAPAMKYVVHWSYQWTDWDSFKMPRDGLCRAFGAAAFAECRGVPTLSVDHESFDYSNWNFSAAPEAQQQGVLGDNLLSLRRAAAALSH